MSAMPAILQASILEQAEGSAPRAWRLMLAWRWWLAARVIQGWRSSVLAPGRWCGFLLSSDLISPLDASDTPSQHSPEKLHLPEHKARMMRRLVAVSLTLALPT